jgi:hypothetical protein
MLDVVIYLFAAINFCLLCVSIYYNVRFGLIILKMQDAVEECLDALDEKFAIFSKILEKPVFFDSVEVRQVISEIKGCQDLILKIANSITDMGGPGESKEK